METADVSLWCFGLSFLQCVLEDPRSLRIRRPGEGWDLKWAMPTNTLYRTAPVIRVFISVHCKLLLMGLELCEKKNLSEALASSATEHSMDGVERLLWMGINEAGESEARPRGL